MKRKLGAAFMVLGAVLLLGAAGLFLRNQAEAGQAESASAALMPLLHTAIEENSSQSQPQPDVSLIPPELLTPEEKQMTEVEIDGYGYIGCLTIPRLSLELPVMADWDYTRLKIAPCRFSGTTIENNLVIIAHNYRRHFGSLGQLEYGDTVIFMDMDGNSAHYLVAAIDVVLPTAVEEVTSGSSDLTLVTCTYGGKTRLVVYCDACTPEA